MKENVFRLGMIFIRRERIITAVVFALTIFAQCVLFHYLIYKEILFSTLWHSPVDFFRFYLPAATEAVFFAGFVFLFKNRWWTVVVSLLINVWILANLWYFRANGILVDHYAIGMIGNLNGFWDSILALIKPVDFIFVGLTTILATVLFILRKRESKKQPRWFLTIVGIALVMGLTNGGLLVKKYKGDWSFMNPMKELLFHYVNDYSVIRVMFMTLKDFALMQDEEKYILTEQERNRVNLFINPKSFVVNTDKQLILCVIESFNSFVITKEFMPNLQNFIDTNNHILLSKNITSQIKYGGSSDGQMIIQTGLLPLERGATCYRFCYNEYPALSHLYKNSTIILPHEKHVWNQARMNDAYGITSSLDKQSDNDKELFKITIQESGKNSFVMMLTISTHIPYTTYSDSSNLIIPDTVQTTLKNYIKSANVLDRGMAILFEAISSDVRLRQSTIVITGDHCMPVPIDENFNNEYNYSRFIPLIIYSPEIEQKTIISDTCYQMDIYPTILHLIGCENYYWKGFGVNLLDSSARHHRPITPEEAYDLSDMLIRADYFSQFK